jgi:hypothetical protein
VQPGPIQLEPLPEKPVADPAGTPENPDDLPVLVPVVQQSGPSFVAGEATASSAGMAGVALSAMMAVAALY